MSRVHDALRRASQEEGDVRGQRQARSDRGGRPPAPPSARQPLSGDDPAQPSRRYAPPSLLADPAIHRNQEDLPSHTALAEPGTQPVTPPATQPLTQSVTQQERGLDRHRDVQDLEEIIHAAREIVFRPQKEALIVHPLRPREAPAEEFKTLRTRLDHLQRAQPLHTLVITSASPAEGKSFTAINLAITQSQIAEKRVLLADFDFRRPSVHSSFQIPCCPGITDYLTGKAHLQDILCRVAGTNLFVLPAGESVPNPLELLNLRETRTLIDDLRNHFDWVILDSPPLLFAADGNLLSTMCDGTILVVRIGSTTYDSVTRAMQSLCENNVLGVVVNGARRGELYSKYDYYHDYYYSPEDGAPVEGSDGEGSSPDRGHGPAAEHSQEITVNTQ